MVYWGGIIAVFLFYFLILGVGIWAARKAKEVPEGQSKAEDLMLAGRKIGLFVGICTMTATWVGGGYINGTAEGVFTPGYGLIWCQAPIGYAISLVIGGYFFAGKMRDAGYVTMLDPFQKKFGERMGGCMFIPALMGETFWTAAILSALGATISVIVEVGDSISIVVSAGIAILYTTFGGLYSVAYTDVVQLVCTFFGLWISIPFILKHDHVKPLSKTVHRWVGEPIPVDQIGVYADLWLMLMFGGIPWQVYFQRVLSSKTSRRAQFLSYFAGLGCIIMAIPSILIGAAAASVDWNTTSFPDVVNNTIKPEEYRKVLPIVLRYLCPPWVAFFGLGAVSAAVMSSADSSILSAASMFARNIVKSIFWQSATDSQVIWTMQISTLFVGTIACIMGLYIQSIYALWALCSDLVYVILFPQLSCVIYFERANTYGSFIGYLVGAFFRVAAGEAAFSIPAIIEYPFFDSTSETQLFPFRTFSMLMSLFTILSVSAITDRLFKSGVINKNKDIFKCFEDLNPATAAVIPTDTDQSVARVEPPHTLHVKKKSREQQVVEESKLVKKETV